MALGIWTSFLQPLVADRHLAAVSGLHGEELGMGQCTGTDPCKLSLRDWVAS